MSSQQPNWLRFHWSYGTFSSSSLNSCSLNSYPALSLNQCGVWSSNISLKACAVGPPLFLLSILISSNKMLCTPLRKHRGGILAMLILLINIQIRFWFPKCQRLLLSELYLLWLTIAQTVIICWKHIHPDPPKIAVRIAAGRAALCFRGQSHRALGKILQQSDFQRLNSCVCLEFFMCGPWMHLSIWCKVLIIGESREGEQGVDGNSSHLFQFFSVLL